MGQLTANKRIELEIEVRKSAIHIAHGYGLAGIEYFSQQFSDIAKEYAQALEGECKIANQFSEPLTVKIAH